jgi:hypothetical protein
MVCIAASASAAPRSGGDDNGRGHAFGLQLQNDDVAAHASAASWLALADHPLGRHAISIEREPRGNAYGHHRFHGWKPTGKTPRPVSAIPEPSGALLFGAGVALVALGLRRID